MIFWNYLSMIKPHALKPNSTIGIVSPSSWIYKYELHAAVKVFKQKGYRLVLGKSVYLKENVYSGSPEQRAEDINAMFADSNIDAIICARGGYGANRVLPLLDYKLIKANPKIFMGYSDITAILTSITQKTGLVTFHGPMLSTFKKGINKFNFELMENTLSGNNHVRIPIPKKSPIRILKSGIAEGSLWGGNMTLLINRIGTKDQLKTDGTILFIEDTNEFYYAFDRMLVHMKEAGMFKKIRGLIIGEMVNMHDEKISFGKSTDEIVMDVCSDLEIPIISNFPCGHGKYQVTLPISAPVVLNAKIKTPTVEIPQSPVRKKH